MTNRSRTGLRGRAGYSMIEALISISVFSVVLMGLHQLAISSEKSQELGTRISHANQDLRAALEIISRDLRMAGSGFAGISVQTADGPIREVIHPVSPGYTYAADADSVSILAGLDGVGTLLTDTMSSPSAYIECSSLEGFSPGDLVVVTDGVSADLFEVTDIVPKGGGPGGRLEHAPSSPRNNPGGHTQWPAGGYVAGSHVVKVNQISLRPVDDGGVLKLFRRIDGGEAIPIVENVNTITFTYRLSDGTETRNPPSPEDIVEIILSIDAGLRPGWGLDDRSVATSTSVRPRSI
jgi:hypothetical protein